MQYESCYGNCKGSAKFKNKKQNGWKPVCFVPRNSCWPTETKCENKALLNKHVVECLEKMGNWKKVQP